VTRCWEGWFSEGGRFVWSLPAGDSPGSRGEEHNAEQAEPKGLGPRLAMKRWWELKSELEGWGEGAFAMLLLV